MPLKNHFKDRRLALGWSLLIFLLLCIPSNGMNENLFILPHLDKLVHFSLFAVFSFLWGEAKQPNKDRERYSSNLIFITGTLYGIALELMQQLPFISRTFDYYDMIANSCGCSAIYLFRRLKF